MTTIVNVVGARPQFIKAGPVSKALAEFGLNELLLHTGQHYDPILSTEIMRDVGLRDPDINLGVGSASHAAQTGAMLKGIEGVLIEHDVDAVLTYGDTNSTVAAALASAKLGIFTAHVEAGLRSFNRHMPEEVNRVATDHLSDLLFAPTETALGHLTREGLDTRTLLTGDVMVDALNSIDLTSIELPEWLQPPYYLATIHREENTDNLDTLEAILDSLRDLDHQVNLLAHPRLKTRMASAGIEANGTLNLREPLLYAEMLAAIKQSEGLFTDSGGLQKESFILRTPCVTIRTETEWPETLAGGWNVVSVPGAALTKLAKRETQNVADHPFGDGHAAGRIVAELRERI